MNNKHIETSVIAEDASIEGDIDFVGTMIVEGKLDGNLKGSDITVQKTGVITGTLNINTLNCHGRVEGDIKAKHIIAHGDSLLKGEIQTDTLEVMTGAKMNGQLVMRIGKDSSGTSSVNPFANVAKKEEPVPVKQAKQATK